MSEAALKIMKELKDFGFEAYYSEIDREMEEILESEEGQVVGKRRMTDDLFAYLTGSDFDPTMHIGNVELFRERMGSVEELEALPEWFFYGLCVTYHYQEKELQFYVEGGYEEYFVTQERIKSSEAYFEKNMETKDWEEYKVKNIFQPKEAQKIIQRWVMEKLSEVIPQKVKNKNFKDMQKRIEALIGGEYDRLIGVK